MQLNGLLEFIDLNRTGFRKALKKHDKVLGGLPHHHKLQPEYLPEVDDKFADKNRPHLQARFWPAFPVCDKIYPAPERPAVSKEHM